jgi:hypothetical protein
MVARQIKPFMLEDGLTSSVTAMLSSLAGNMSLVAQEMVGNHTMDLLAMSLAATLHCSRPRVSSAKALLLSNIRSVIEARLTHHDLNAQTGADAVGVSVRYANQVLTKQQTSQTGLIQTRRLARCRYALEDPT